ncbi:MAG: UDP-galactopyranose mutase [Terrimicrobiaceae bacterium]
MIGGVAPFRPNHERRTRRRRKPRTASPQPRTKNSERRTPNAELLQLRTRNEERRTSSTPNQERRTPNFFNSERRTASLELRTRLQRKRLPVRFNYDDNYYSKKYQGIPFEGYTEVIRSILDHPQITVHLNKAFTFSESQHFSVSDFSHIFYTGPIDAFFDYSEGRLG